MQIERTKIGYLVGGGLKENFRVRLTVSPQEIQEGAFVVIQSGDWNYYGIVTDIQLSRIGDTQGLDLLDLVAERCPGTPVVVLTAYGSHRIEREARNRGASFFLYKPVRLDDIGQIVFGLLEPK